MGGKNRGILAKKFKKKQEQTCLFFISETVAKFFLETGLKIICVANISNEHTN